MKQTTVQRVSGHNWQGRSFTIDLEPLAVIVGENMEGKSSVPHAMRVGLTGYSPAHGKKAGATFGFIGDPNGATKGGVELGFSDGVSVNRLTWEMKRGKIESGEARMDVKVPAVLLDLKEEFFKLSGPKRTDFIFSKMDMTALGFSVDEITARLKRDVKATAPTELTEEALADIVEDVIELDRERVELGQTYQEWLAAVCDKIKGRADESKTTLDQMAGLIQGTTVLQGSSPILAPFDADDLRKAREHNAALVAQRNNATAYAETTARLTAQRAAYVAALQSAPNHSGEITKMEAEITEQEKEIKKFKSGTQAAFDKFHKANAASIEDQALVNRRVEVLEDRLSALADDKKHKACPKCKQKGKTWEKALALEADEIEEERKAIATENTRLKGLKATLDALGEAHKAEQQKDKDQQGRIETKARKEKRLAELRLAQTTVKVEIPFGNATAVNNLTRDVVTERIKSCDEQLAAPSVPSAPAPEEIAKATSEVNRLESLERAHSAQQADALRAEEGRAKHATAEAEREIATGALAVIQKLKGEMMDKAFAGFLGKVNRFCMGLFRHNKQGVSWRDGEIGYLRGATWVSLDHFSGTEEMLTYLGLSVALAEESPVRIVFVDEWLRDPKLRINVAQRFKELQKGGHIDQVVIIDVAADGYTDLGYKIVTL